MKIFNNCLWMPKTSPTKKKTGLLFPSKFCLNVRKSQILDKFIALGLPRKYLIWSSVQTEQCEDFFVTSAFDIEKDMFDIFWESPKSNEFYSPTCCWISNDNVNVPIVDDGLTMCQCYWNLDYSIIDGIPVAKKGWDIVKKALH